ncbi:MAG TPA: carbohydrate kinase family protein [Candidatus Limnocylindrales bacterium]|nr:carbohydrate kinase family protein [Candidatus Limnocylindrales bacterium]
MRAAADVDRDRQPLSRRVVVFGAASWNMLIRVERFPDPGPATVFPPGWHETVGSSGAGKALNLARLGVPVTLHCLLGDDQPGARIRTMLEAAGVTVDAVTDPTGTARHVNLMDPAGRRLSFLLHTGDPAIRYNPDRVAGLVAAADHVVVEIVDQARVVLPIARRLGKPTWTDLHATDGERAWERDFWSADRVLFSGEHLADPRPFMERLRRDGRLLVVCTRAEHGTVALTADGRWIEIPAEPVATVVDTNGAGDAFAAGTIAGVMRGDPVDDSLRLGAHVAALAVQSADLAPPSV